MSNSAFAVNANLASVKRGTAYGSNHRGRNVSLSEKEAVEKEGRFDRPPPGLGTVEITRKIGVR